MLNAIIIDDEENGLVSLNLLIKKITPNVRVVDKTTDPKRGIEMINDYRPDIVFLDINMPLLDGFGVLESADYKKFHLIFTTAHEEYALKAIKKNAIDYLLKPIGKDELLKAIEKVEYRIRKNETAPDVFTLLKEISAEQKQKITVPTKTGIDLVAATDIMYIEANSNSAIITYTNGEQVHTLKSLKEFESNLLGNTSFIRVQNSFIINLHCVAKYVKEDGGYAVMQNKKSIPVSKQKKDEFLKKINMKVD